MVAAVGHLPDPAVVLGLQVGQILEVPEGEEGALQIANGALHLALDSGFLAPRITGRIRKAPKREITSGWRRAGREWGTTIEESRSTATASGAPPSRSRVPEKAGRKSATPFDKVETVAWAAECGRVVTRP